MLMRGRLSGIRFKPDRRKGGYRCTIQWGRRQETWWVETMEMLRLHLAAQHMLKKETSVRVRVAKK
jgi:hypothetical protein